MFLYSVVDDECTIINPYRLLFHSAFVVKVDRIIRIGTDNFSPAAQNVQSRKLKYWKNPSVEISSKYAIIKCFNRLKDINCKH